MIKIHDFFAVLRNNHTYFYFSLANFFCFCYNKIAMSDLTKIISPLTFINTTYTKDTFDMSGFHKHESLEIVYVASGSIQMSYQTTKDAPLKQITLHENQFMIIRPRIRHFQCVPQEARMMVLELRHTNPHVDIENFIINSDFISMIPMAKTLLQKLGDVTIVTDIHDVKRIMKKVLKLLYEAQHNNADEYFSVYYELFLKQFAIEICKCISVKTTKRYNRYIQYVLSFIQKNYGNPITVQQIAENLNLSAVYLNNVFKKEIGTSIQSHLISVRIQQAQELLLEQNFTVSAVAKKVGYQNLRSFEVTFLKKVGVSPSQYQKKKASDGFILWKNHADESVAVDISPEND